VTALFSLLGAIALHIPKVTWFYFPLSFRWASDIFPIFPHILLPHIPFGSTPANFSDFSFTCLSLFHPFCSFPSNVYFHSCLTHFRSFSDHSHAPTPSADPPDRFFLLLSFAFCLRYFFILILFILSNPLHSGVLSALCSIFPLSLFVYDFHILVCMLLSLGFPYIICSDIVSTPTTNPLIYRADQNTLFWHTSGKAVFT
jgi:hypothetical protein